MGVGVEAPASKMCLPLQDIVIRLYLTTFIKTLLIFMLITLNLFIVAVFYYR